MMVFLCLLNSTICCYQYLGCFVDSIADRTLPEEFIVDLFMTTSKCYSICCTRGPYTYFGTEVGRECYCGYSNIKFVKRSDGECTSLCGGNFFEKCGAGNRLSIYKADGSLSLPKVLFSECPFAPEPNETTTNSTSDPVTTANCADMCKCNTTPSPLPLNISVEEILKIQEAIRKELLLDKKSTTLYKITKISAPDNRTSSVSIGAVGIIMVLLPVIAGLISDFMRLYK